MKEKIRKFVKGESVFKDWKEDNPTLLSKSLMNDIKYWKVQRLSKDDNEYSDIIQTLLKYIAKLKHIYIDLISNSSYPSISWTDFGNYANKIG